MGLRSMIRDEFPRGWWRSASWWLEGVKEIGRNCAVALATAVFARHAARMVRDRDDPVALSRSKVTDEGWCTGLLVAAVLLGAGVALALSASPGSSGTAAVATAMILWSLANLTTAAAALAVLMRSRIRRRGCWEEIDFVDLNAPRRGRPPETVEEYRALRLQREQGRD